MTEVTPESPQPEKNLNWILVALDYDAINGPIVAGTDSFMMDEETAKSKEETLKNTSVYLRWVALEVPPASK